MIIAIVYQQPIEMTSKILACFIILTLSLLLSYLIEAQPVASPSGEPTRMILEGDGTLTAAKVKEMVPKCEEFLQQIKRRIDELPASSPHKECLKSCMPTYDKEVAEMKRFAGALEASTTGEVTFEPAVDRALVAKCDQCLVEMTKEDPATSELTKSFIFTVAQVGEQINKYNS